MKMSSKLYFHNVERHFKNFFVFLVVVLLVWCIFLICMRFWIMPNNHSNYFESVNLNSFYNLPEVEIKAEMVFRPSNSTCSHWDCFNIFRCGRTGHDRIAVFVYPLIKYTDIHSDQNTAKISREFYMILDTIIKSKYYTANPFEACIFVPSVDTLNQENFDGNFTSKVLNSLEYWNNGQNHLIFNMLSGSFPNYSSFFEVGDALIAGADFDTYNYRVTYDIPIPIFSPFAKQSEIKKIHNHRSWLVASTQINIDPYFMDQLQEFQSLNLDILILDSCQTHNYSIRCEIETQKMYFYSEILQKTTFCLIFRGERMAQVALMEAMAANCIPVVVMDGHVMPFSNVLDWNRAAIFIMEDYLHTLMDVLKKISQDRVQEMQKQVKFLYDNYFSSIESIVNVTLDIIQDRVYPQWGKNYDDWNLRPDERNKNPLYLPITASRTQGFTAVILTYDRVESLYNLIRNLSKVPSLSKILVVWNNQKKAPPSVSNFPKISKAIKVIRTKANKLSNRFYPYEEIETEAILSIDDDIVMLTSDELEFGFEVWREFPDRIVGFPSRTHIWDNTTMSWKYESEWTNEISMVLTGAAFYHKYWNYLYTTSMPPEVRDWVDEKMNCEDIAMNFLVSNATKKPPIKVAPRKKFKCPECTNNEMLSADIRHMVERSNCINKFVKVFGGMPLKSVEFRADPVLYKDVFPEKLKRFNNIGSL